MQSISVLFRSRMKQSFEFLKSVKVFETFEILNLELKYGCPSQSKPTQENYLKTANGVGQLHPEC